ncbi:MAG: TIGR01212 family radical SAM protein [Epulopiscium sp. Nele67-Bin001]|nr:MAG: TIGR01212 family radical SAM protein [Epulopiscium sp. Nele67-Bin001]
MSYNRYADFLTNKYGAKVYKVSLHLEGTCPNKDGNCSSGGCTFCADVGTAYESPYETKSIPQQLNDNIEYMKKRYKAKYFIGYLQNYSNTYMSKERLKDVLSQIKHHDLVGISISTRPDCINDEYLQLIKDNTSVDVCIELGLQTVNYHSLSKINRGHSLAEFIDAVLRIKNFGFESAVHLILNLPWDDMTDTIENAKIISALGLTYVKLHALYILKDTVMAKQYYAGEIELISEEEYKERVITFLRYLDKKIVIQRIIGRVPEGYSIFANWGSSWWKIHDDILALMQQQGYQQGDLCDYLNGKALQANYLK